MLEKLRENPRVVVVTLVAVGVLALIIGGGNNDDSGNTVQTEDAAVTQEADVQKVEEAATEDTEAVIGPEPTAGPVAVDKEDTKYGAVVREGDNQTVVARQIVNEYLSDQSQSLSAEQRLYVETVLVDGLPRNDLVYPGDKIEVDESVVAQVVADSGELTQAQIAAWSAYL